MATKKRSKSRRSAGTKQKKPFFPAWLLLLMGIAIGVIIAYAGPLKELLTSKDQPIARVEIQQPVPEPRPAPRQEAPPKVVNIIPPAQEPKYDFYYRLPQEEVVVKEEEYRSVTKPQAVFQENTPRTSTTDSGKRYLIQAGSFRTNKDADSRKAALALLGLKSSIKKVNTDSGRWYRVLLGPFDSMDQVARIRTELHSNKIKTLMINASGQ